MINPAPARLLREAADGISEAAATGATRGELDAFLTELGDEGLSALSGALHALSQGLKDAGLDGASEGVFHAAADIDDAWGKLGDAVDTLNTTENGANR